MSKSVMCKPKGNNTTNTTSPFFVLAQRAGSNVQRGLFALPSINGSTLPRAVLCVHPIVLVLSAGTHIGTMWECLIWRRSLD